MQPSVLFAWMVMLPMIAFYVVFTGIPLVMAFVQSMEGGTLASPTHPFVGLQNYQYELTEDPVFWTTVANTLTFAFATVVIGNTASLGLALLVSRVHRFSGFFRTVFYLPGVTTAVAVTAIWTWLYDSNEGLLNALLRWMGLPGQEWLNSVQLALPSVIAMSVWWGIGGGMLIYLAGLQGIDATLYEAAKVDGAGAIRLFWHVTLPQLRPMLVFQSIIGIIAGMQVFAQTYLLTKGGPIDASRSMVEYMYETAFASFGSIGSGAAISFLLFAIMFVFVALELWLLRSREERMG